MGFCVYFVLDQAETFYRKLMQIEEDSGGEGGEARVGC